MHYIRTNVSQIGGPFVLRADGVYYMYATSSPAGFNVYRSEDLVSWENLGLCYDGLKGWGFMDFWAPEVVEYNGGYAMFFTAKSKALNALRTGVAFAKSPVGPFVDTGAPLFDFGYSTIDASPFFDEDGQAYLYYVRDCSDNVIDGVHTSQIYVTRLAPDLRSVEGVGELISTPDCAWECHPDWQWNEGPSVIKRGGKYYLTYSVNCFDSREYSVGYAVSDSPTGPFRKATENPILRWREGEMSGPGHNSFFIDEAGNTRAAFHIHTAYERPSGDRTACICDTSIEGGKLRFLV